MELKVMVRSIFDFRILTTQRRLKRYWILHRLGLPQ